MWTFIFICTKFNETQLDAKIIRSLYFQKEKKSIKTLSDLKRRVIMKRMNHMGRWQLSPIKFTIWDKYHDFSFFKCLRRLCCCLVKRNQERELLYKLGQQRIQEDFNVFKWIQTFYKIKASLLVILEQISQDRGVCQNDLILKIMERYAEQVTLRDKEEEKQK